MAKYALAAIDAPHAPRPDDPDSQKESELPPAFPDPTEGDQRPAPRRSHSVLHGLAAASQATTSNSQSLVEQEAREQSNPINDFVGPHCQPEEIGLGKPGPYEQTPRACKHTYATNTRNHVAGSPANAGHCGSIYAVGRTVAKPVPQPSQERLDGGRPRVMVKVLIYGDSNDPYSAADIRFFKATCLKCWSWRGGRVLGNPGGTYIMIWALYIKVV